MKLYRRRFDLSTAEQNKLSLAYEGSVKRVFESPFQENSLLFQFSDDYSVFDWGKMPDTISNKGKSLAVLGAYFFDLLAMPKQFQSLKEKESLQSKFEGEFLDRLLSGKTANELKAQGLVSHFSGLLDENGEDLLLENAGTSPALFMQVNKALVQRPFSFSFENRNLYHYPPADRSARARLIPLEVVFRFGMPAGSSLKERLERNPDYIHELNLKKAPEPGKLFERPVLEFYTKLEAKDRLLSFQEALLISGLEASEFTELSERALSAALALFNVFAEKQIELWDGKFEFITENGKILLADSIGPDELRLLYRGVHLSKEMIRQVYRGTSWERSLKESQEIARSRGTLDWKSICLDELKAAPQPLRPEVKKVLDQLYPVLANHVTGQEIFSGLPKLAEFVDSVHSMQNGLRK